MNHGINGTTVSRAGKRMLVSFFTPENASRENSGEYTVMGQQIFKRKAVPCPVCGHHKGRTEVEFEGTTPVGGHCITCDSQFGVFHKFYSLEEMGK